MISFLFVGPSSLFFTEFDEEPAERVEQSVTKGATKKSSRHKRVGVGKGVLRAVLFAARTLTPLAAKLSVKSLEFELFWIQLVLITFNGLQH